MLKQGDLVRFKHEHLKEMRRLGWRVENRIMRIERLLPFETWNRRRKRYSCMAVMDVNDDVTGSPINASTSSLVFYARPGNNGKKATQGHSRTLTRKLLGLS